ncbi:MAG: hypothetical protein JHC57_07975 [Sphingopyxis sp.]|uniref:hypothetical protein n=1 Tax=Sphingopyxis sp. TaxID=1908224 RepID=UPI001A1FF8C7|nr:hypothetical protein [Sphingopyxis sp.]MBJ7499674.1 hypothetical protein [Sphingopyxis sp.]
MTEETSTGDAEPFSQLEILRELLRSASDGKPLSQQEMLHELLSDECPLTVENRAGEGWQDADWIAHFRDLGYAI